MGNSSFIAGDGYCYGERQLGGYFYIYTHIYQEIATGYPPSFRGTPRCGIQVRTIFLATDTRRVHHDTRRLGTR